MSGFDTKHHCITYRFTVKIILICNRPNIKKDVFIEYGGVAWGMCLESQEDNSSKVLGITGQDKKITFPIYSQQNVPHFLQFQKQNILTIKICILPPPQ